MNDLQLTNNSSYWTTFVKLTFVVALIGMGSFVFFMDGNLLTKGYLALNSLFLVSSTIMLSKTLRDDHEAKRALYYQSNLELSKAKPTE
jgi:hypothetical protein